MYEGDSRTQSFGVSSGIRPAQENPAESVYDLRHVFNRTDGLAAYARDLRRVVDELDDGPARTALLNWCEIAEQVSGALRRAALAQLDAATARVRAAREGVEL